MEILSPFEGRKKGGEAGFEPLLELCGITTVKGSEAEYRTTSKATENNINEEQSQPQLEYQCQELDAYAIVGIKRGWKHEYLFISI